MSIAEIGFWAFRVSSSVSAVPAVTIGRRKGGLLWIYAWLDALCDTSGFILACCKVNNRPWLTDVFILCEVLLVGNFLLRAVLPQSKWVRAEIIMLTAGIAFIAHTFAYTFQEHPVEGNYLGGAFFYGLLILLCIPVLAQVLQQVEYIKIECSPVFIFTAGFLLYASGTIFILLVKKVVYPNDHALMNHLWIVLRCLNIIKNGALAWALWLQKTSIEIDTK